MFKRMFILVFALFSILHLAGGPTASADTQSPELLVNPGFENGITGWAAQLASVTLDMYQVHSGSSALKISNRSKDWSTAVQNVTGALQSYGAGHYKFSAYVKLVAPLGGGSCSPLLLIKYNDGSDHYATTSRVAINANSYTKLEGTVNVSWNGTLNFAQLYVQTGTGGTECLADIYVDDFSLVNTDRSTPINQSPELLANPGFESGTTGWSAQLATLTLESSQVHSGGSALKISNRSKDWSTAVQNVADALRSYGAGHYKFSAYVKLAAPLGGGSCSPMVVIKYNDGADHYATTSRVAINETNFTKLEGLVNLTWGDLNYAQMYVQTGNGGTECLADMYVDDFSLVNTDRSTPLPPQTGDSTVNLALNKPVTASSTLSSVYNATYVTDGNTDTTNGHEWAADVSQGPQWVVVDFGSSTAFNRVEFYTHEGYEQKEYEIQYWSGSGWNNILNKVNDNTSEHHSYVFKTVTSSKLRIYMTGGNVTEPNVARIVEVEAYNDPNLALNRAVTASSTQNSSYSPSYITDGTEDTISWHGWAADVSQGPQWVVIDFGKTVTFQRVEFFTKSQYQQKEYEIQYWNGSEWINCFPKVTNNTSDHNSHTFPSVSSSKLRVYLTEGNVQQPDVARINQVKVFNSTGAYSEYFPDPIPQDISDRQEKTAVGAIRWDMWGATSDPNDPGSQTQKTLSPGKYHFRLPWYATVTGTDSASIPQYTQEIVDEEIEYAKKAGIDYWAFVMYESPTARDLYLSSEHKDDVKWSAILGASGYSLNNYPWLVSQFKTSNYQKVLNGRPLVYVWSTNKMIVDTLRSESEKQGVPDPYIVIMGANGKVMKQMQGDALSSYVNPVAGGAPYSAVMANDQANWGILAGYGVQVIPTVSTGWDPRPRIDNPVSWAKYSADGWAETATPNEIADNLQSALDWNESHPSLSLPNAVLMYAWNENDEGGWIIPTLGADGQPDTSRLDAIQSVLRPDVTPPTTSAVLTPEQPDGSSGWYVHPIAVTLTATDDSSGVAKTEYSLDDGTTWQSYTNPVTLSQDGLYTVSYRSTDKAGNMEIAKTVSFKLDATAPSIAVTGPADNSSLSDAGDISPDLKLGDNLSGIDGSKTTVTLDTYAFQAGTMIPLYTLPLGGHTFTVTTGDTAGNTSVKTVTFQTFTSIDALKALVARLAGSGRIDNGGIANSLQKKLDQGSLAAFRNEVKAQSGKHIEAETAKYLLRDADALIGD